MRKEMREALETFWRWMSEGHFDKLAARNLFAAIEWLGGLEAALADDPTDNTPDLAAVVAAQGVALQSLGQQVRFIEADLRAVEAALMDERRARTGDEAVQYETEPWGGRPAQARTPEEGWLVEPVRLVAPTLPAQFEPHAQYVRWSMLPNGCYIHSRKGVTFIPDGQRVGVRPDGRLEVVS